MLVKALFNPRCVYRRTALAVTCYSSSRRMSTPPSSTPYLADVSSPFCGLDVSKSFGLLTAKEKKYTHFINRASWAGVRIIQEQWSPHATALYDLLIAVFSDNGHIADLHRLKEQSDLSDTDWQALLQYTAQVLNRPSSLLHAMLTTIIDSLKFSQLSLFWQFKDSPSHRSREICCSRSRFTIRQCRSASLEQGTCIYIYLPRVVLINII